jgi:hypothetical protein
VGRGRSGTAVAGLALAVVLAGCGGHSGKPSTSTSERRSSSATAPIAATTPVTAPTDAYWPYAKLINSLAGRTLTLARGTVRLDAALLECNGEGNPMQTGGTRGWARYTCTQTMFAGGVDQDVTFDVAIQSGTDLRITSPRYGSE